MIAISFFVARWLVRRMARPFVVSQRLAMGMVALVLLLGAEFGFVLWLRGMSLQQYFATRDPVASAAYYVALLLFAAMPLWVGRDQQTIADQIPR
jgi:type IV secretory pathway TrbD component